MAVLSWKASENLVKRGKLLAKREILRSEYQISRLFINPNGIYVAARVLPNYFGEHPKNQEIKRGD